jgi:hypothetical protein
MHPLIQTMVLTVLLPAVVGGAFMLAAALVSPGRWRNAMAALGLAAGWGLGVWWTVRVPHWPPGQAADWQFCAVAAAAMLALITPVWRTPFRWQWLAGFAFYALFFALLLQRILAGLWPGPGAWIWPAGLAALALLNAAAVERVGHSVQAAWTFFGLTAFSVVLSAGLMLAGSAALGHTAGIMAAACGAMWLVAWALRRQLGMGQAGFVVVVIAGGLLAQGVHLAGLKPVAALLFAVGWPAAALAAWVLRHGSGKVRAVVVILLLLAPSAAGLALLAR